MPYKDKKQRYAAVRRARAKKSEKYRLMSRDNKRKAARRGYHIHFRYGLSFEDYTAMLQKQHDACAICGKVPQPTKSGRSGLHVDHDHATGKVRGLLCARCNTFVGYMDQADYAELATRAEGYLGR